MIQLGLEQCEEMHSFKRSGFSGPGLPSHVIAELTHDTCARIMLCMNLTLSVDDEIIEEARRRAEAMGKSVNQLVREYLEQLAGKSNREALMAELREMTRNSTGNSRGWKFNREELHERR